MELISGSNRPASGGQNNACLDVSEEIPSVYFDLEDTLELRKAQDIVNLHNENKDKLIILDEVQRLPEVFAQLRGIIDKERRKQNNAGLFLFLGSASLDLLQQSSESLAEKQGILQPF